MHFKTFSSISGLCSLESVMSLQVWQPKISLVIIMSLEEQNCHVHLYCSKVWYLMSNNYTQIYQMDFFWILALLIGCTVLRKQLNSKNLCNHHLKKAGRIQSQIQGGNLYLSPHPQIPPFFPMGYGKYLYHLRKTGCLLCQDGIKTYLLYPISLYIFIAHVTLMNRTIESVWIVLIVPQKWKMERVKQALLVPTFIPQNLLFYCVSTPLPTCSTPKCSCSEAALMPHASGWKCWRMTTAQAAVNQWWMRVGAQIPQLPHLSVLIILKKHVLHYFFWD